MEMLFFSARWGTSITTQNGKNNSIEPFLKAVAIYKKSNHIVVIISKSVRATVSAALSSAIDHALDSKSNSKLERLLSYALLALVCLSPPALYRRFVIPFRRYFARILTIPTISTLSFFQRPAPNFQCFTLELLLQ